MRNIGKSFLAIAALMGTAQLSAQAAGAESSGQMGAALGASLFEMGQTAGGGTTYVAHGYAAAETKTSDASKPETKAPGTGASSGAGDMMTTGALSTLTGEFSFRIKDYCASSAQAQVFPMGLIADAPTTGAGSDPSFFVTGVKVDLADQQQETCTTSVKVTYGINLPPKSKLTQIGYVVFLAGKKRAPDAKPEILPRAPL